MIVEDEKRHFNPLQGLFSSKGHELITTYLTSMQSQLVGSVAKFFLHRPINIFLPFG
jgi:hypothetical protein